MPTAIYTIRSLLHAQDAHIYNFVFNLEFRKSLSFSTSSPCCLRSIILCDARQRLLFLATRSPTQLTHSRASSSLSLPPASAPPRPSHSYSLALAPFHPASSATISAHLSPIASTVSIGFTLVISGNTPASAILTPSSPLNLKRQSTTAISSLAKSPILVVPAGW